MVVKMAGLKVNLPAGESLPYADLHTKVQEMERAMSSMQQQQEAVGGGFGGGGGGDPGGAAAPLPGGISGGMPVGGPAMPAGASTAGMVTTAEFDQWQARQELFSRPGDHWLRQGPYSHVVLCSGVPECGGSPGVVFSMCVRAGRHHAGPGPLLATLEAND